MKNNSTRSLAIIACALLIGATAYPTTAQAGGFKYHRKVTLRIGQSVILKGVRGKCSSSTARKFRSLRLPKTRLGTYSDGGAGTVDSISCKKNVPARGVKFTAKKQGHDKITIYGDPIIIHVKP